MLYFTPLYCPKRLLRLGTKFVEHKCQSLLLRFKKRKKMPNPAGKCDNETIIVYNGTNNCKRDNSTK